GPCLDTFIRSPLGLGSLLVFGTLAAASIYMIIRNGSMRSRIRWSYPLVFSLLFLISYFAFSMMCHDDLLLCSEHALMYSIPAAVMGSFLFGYILMPNIYLAWSNAALSEALSAKLPSSVPVYVTDKGKPFAFSYGGYKRWIVVSQGMIDILSGKELEAVLLHEYGHLTNNSSLYKTSGWFFSKVPLLRAFFDAGVLEDEEERGADAFAARLQGTGRFLNSAKRKMESYYSA
ncbi:MAG: M48 family metalloprotease, partial [Candidatus Micrarchaeota archaeon]